MKENLFNQLSNGDKFKLLYDALNKISPNAISDVFEKFNIFNDFNLKEIVYWKRRGTIIGLAQIHQFNYDGTVSAFTFGVEPNKWRNDVSDYSNAFSYSEYSEKIKLTLDEISKQTGTLYKFRYNKCFADGRPKKKIFECYSVIPYDEFPYNLQLISEEKIENFYYV